MLILEHLKKQNHSTGQGSRYGYAALASRYLINYLIKRLPLIGSLGGNLYKSRKKLLYTVLTGDYDQLNEIPLSLSRSKKWDFVCVTENSGRTIGNRGKAKQIECTLDTWPVGAHHHLNIGDSEFLARAARRRSARGRGRRAVRRRRRVVARSRGERRARRTAWGRCRWPRSP